MEVFIFLVPVVSQCEWPDPQSPMPHVFIFISAKSKIFLFKSYLPQQPHKNEKGYSIQL